MKLAAIAVMTAPTICSTPVATAIIGEEMCQAMHWPMPLPPSVGYSLNHLVNDSVLTCLNNVMATAPDGHDATNDPESVAYAWKVTSMSPAAGTMVQRNQRVIPLTPPLPSRCSVSSDAQRRIHCPQRASPPP
jgi:hypothetical protein